MTPKALQIIKDEHLSIAAVIYSLRYLVRQIRDKGAAPDFRLLYAILDYIVEYPDRLHHPKENDYLFKALRERNAEAEDIIAELEAEHVRGDQLIIELKANLKRYEDDEKRGLEDFARSVEEYADFQWQHMSKEESIVMPMAEKSLTQEDWDRIATAFIENDNPLFGIKPKEQSEQMFRTILNLAPPPIGVGPSKR